MNRSTDTTQTSILDPETTGRLDARWSEIQTRFVDEPREAVADADRLVTDTIGEITSLFEGDRSRLEDQWGEGHEPTTEDLRRLMQRYRELFSRLLGV